MSASKLKGVIKRVRLTLFFLLVVSGILFLTRPVLAALPTINSISPLSGSIAPDIPKTFTCKYSDSDGWTNLKEAYLLISASSTTLTNSAYLYYDQNSNLLYLRDDSNTAWLGGYAPGAANIIENSRVKLNCASTTVSGSSYTLTVNWNITFKPAYSPKAYNTYLYVKDDTGGSAGWTKKGSYTVDYPPQPGMIDPSSGTGQVNVAQVFTAAYSDPDGWQNLKYAYLLINTSAFGLNCPYVYYDQNYNKLYLRNDANTSWLGGYAPGSSNFIENSYAKLDCAATSVSGSGTILTVNWSVVLKAPFTGAKNIYLSATDDLNVSSGFTFKGTWAIPNNPPSVGMITPSEGASLPGQTAAFSSAYSDPDTWLNIKYAYLLINASTGFVNCFYAYYDQNSNKLYLRNDADTSWLGGYAPGSSYTIENSYAKLNCASTTVSGIVNDLTINWSVTFKPVFTGVKNTYLYITDDANASAGWTQKGDFCIFIEPISPP